MNRITKHVVSLGLAVTLPPLANAAVPEVTSVSMSQSADRLVTVTYTLENAPAVVTLDIQTNDVASGTWASIGGENIQRVTGDVWKKVSVTSGTIRWQADLDWPGHKIVNSGVRAVVTAWALDNTPDYMVVDISPSAVPNTQLYYPGESFLPGGLFANGDYRSSRLVMRKIMAKDVKWTMGSIGEQRNRETHYVTLPSNYYIAVFQTTQAQYQYLTGANPSLTVGVYRPVEKVSYVNLRNAAYNSNAWAGGNWPNAPYSGSVLDILRQRTGLDFDLPSDAQWEYACRAGHGEGFWGNGGKESDGLQMPGRYNYWKAQDKDTTSEVGRYGANSWGLYDMHGNVWEWCLDWYVDGETIDYNGVVNVNDSDNTKSRGGATGTQRVLRGGSANDSATTCVSSYRWGHNVTLQYEWVGFRVACQAGLK